MTDKPITLPEPAYPKGSECTIKEGAIDDFYTADQVRAAVLADRALNATAQGMWQPIETAPKDGTEILVSGLNFGDEAKGRHVTMASWRNGFGWWEGLPDPVEEELTANTQLQFLTHWMPLPAPPTAAVAGDPVAGRSHDAALHAIAYWPCPEQDDMQSANMRKVALDALATLPRIGSETTASASEREQFEAYIRKDRGNLSTFGSGQNLHYCNSAVNNAWGGWMARAASASVQVVMGAEVADDQRAKAIKMAADALSHAYVRAQEPEDRMMYRSAGLMLDMLFPATSAAPSQGAGTGEKR